MYNKKLLSKVINSLLSEQPRWRKERVDVLHPYTAVAEKYLGQPNVFFTMSNLHKTGIYPRSGESSGPLGIYCYPFTQGIHKQLIGDNLPYAKDRKFIHFFKAKDPSKTLSLGSMPSPEWGKIPTVDDVIYDSLFKLEGKPMKTYEYDDDVGDYVNRETHLDLTTSEKNFLEIHKREKGSDDTVGYALYEYVKKLVNGKAIRWTTELMKLGYHGVVDMGHGRVYNSEPTQAVFFASSFIEALETIPNYYSSDNQIKGSFTALGNYTGNAYSYDSSYRGVSRRANPIKPTKFRFELTTQRFLKNYQITVDELWNSPKHIADFYEEIDNDDAASLMLLFKIKPDILRQTIPFIPRLTGKFEEMVLKRLSREDYDLLKPGQLSGNGLGGLIAKFGDDLEGLVAFLVKHGLKRQITTLPQEALQKIFLSANATPELKKMLAPVLASNHDFRPNLMSDPDENIRITATKYATQEQLLELLLNDPSENVKSAAAEHAAATAAQDPRVREDLAVKIFVQYIRNDGYYKNTTSVAEILKTVFESRNQSRTFLVQVLQQSNRNEFVPFFLRYLTEEEITSFAIRESDGATFSNIARKMPVEKIVQILEKNSSFSHFPGDFLSVLNLDVARTYIHSAKPANRIAVADVLPPDEIEIMANDENTNVRDIVARRITNIELLKKISTEDVSHYIRSAARSQLAYLTTGKI